MHYFLNQINDLSFYGSKNILGWSKFFVPYQKLIYILRKFQIFCARPKDDFDIASSVFVPAQIFLEGTKIQFNFWSDPNYYILGPAKNILGPVEVRPLIVIWFKTLYLVCQRNKLCSILVV